MYEADFADVETFASYNHEGWRGRIRASAGVGGSLFPPPRAGSSPPTCRLCFVTFSKPLAVLHHTFTLVCRKPVQL